MKTAFVVFPAFLLAASMVPAAPQSVTVLERGPHFQIIQTISVEGEVVRTNRYSELASGLNVFREGNWQPAQAEFQIVGNAALAQQLQFEPSLGPNANAEDAVTLVLPDGQVLRSQVIALQYWDAASGETASLGFIQDAQGELVSETQVAYANVLDGLSASLVYEIGLDHLEQNLVLLERPPAPEILNPNLNPATTRLELWTEFVDGVVPAITRREVRPGMTDDFVDYGSMAMAAGRALVVNGEGAAPIYKRWLEIEGRTFLVEYAEYLRIKPLLETLPEAGAAAGQPNRTPPRVAGSFLERGFPSRSRLPWPVGAPIFQRRFGPFPSRRLERPARPSTR